MKKLAIGVDDFKRLREANAYFVDKSLFIEEIIEDVSDVLLFPRPRRFGKTLNMSMLHYFFTNKNPEENRQLFEGLEITKSPVFEQHFGQYPVISLSLSACKCNSFEEFYARLSWLVGDEFRKHEDIFKIENFIPSEIELFQHVCNGDTDQVDIESSILFLSHCLHKYYQQKVIILIDGFDSPVHDAFFHGFYQQIVEFLDKFFRKTLRDNESMKKGVLTGILFLSKETIFKDIDNMVVHTSLSEKFENCFGFTQMEVEEMLFDFDIKNLTTQVTDFYKGYYSGKIELYNPWAILCFVGSNDSFSPYWVNTSANELIDSLIRNSEKSVIKDIEDMLNNLPVYTAFQENISLQNLHSSRENILSFLVQTGYLKVRYFKEQNSNMTHEFFIPNIEIRLLLRDIINRWYDVTIGQSDRKEMFKSLIIGDIMLFEHIMNCFTDNYLSFYQTSKDHIEKVYHAFVLGMLITLKDSYHIESERESGYGRVDILMTPKNKTQPGIIIEMKKIRPRETTETAIEAALKQIEDRQYETTLRQQGCTNIMKVAVTFDGKRVWAKTQD